MFEKVNPSHPDKVADRIAGAMVDLAYSKQSDPCVAVEVLLGHGAAYVIAESSVNFDHDEVEAIVRRIAGNVELTLRTTGQDYLLAENQRGCVRCGDNGIFRGTLTTNEQRDLTEVVRDLYALYPTDGKAVLDGRDLIVCQSHMAETGMDFLPSDRFNVTLNPLGYWEGGIDVDAGATNRKLGSDMGDAVTGGGLHGKDLSKADVSVNVVCHILAKTRNAPCGAKCAIGDETVTFTFDNGLPPETYRYATVVGIARTFIDDLGGFEAFAEWGLIR